MKNFFYVLFGGLFVIGAGITISYVGSLAWNIAKPQIAKIHMPSFTKIQIPSLSKIATVVVSQPTDGTSISGMVRTIRFSAKEEEDLREEEGLINAAKQALPGSANSKITANAYLVKNLTRGKVSIGHDQDQLLPIASVTKLVTAIVANRLIDQKERVSISLDIMTTYGNTAQFKVGEVFTARDLMYPLLMVSSNDAAEALARSYGRSKFIQAMNDFTQSIGAYRTYFADPSGLSPKNVSTADDLVIILDWMRNNMPDILAITELKSKTIRSHTFLNPMHFLNWSNYLGGKNGYTPEANRTGVALFNMGKNKDVYAVVILGSDSRDADVVKLLGKVNDY